MFGSRDAQIPARDKTLKGARYAVRRRNTQHARLPGDIQGNVAKVLVGVGGQVVEVRGDHTHIPVDAGESAGAVGGCNGAVCASSDNQGGHDSRLSAFSKCVMGALADKHPLHIRRLPVAMSRVAYIVGPFVGIGVDHSRHPLIGRFVIVVRDLEGATRSGTSGDHQGQIVEVTTGKGGCAFEVDLVAIKAIWIPAPVVGIREGIALRPYQINRRIHRRIIGLADRHLLLVDHNRLANPGEGGIVHPDRHRSAVQAIGGGMWGSVLNEHGRPRPSFLIRCHHISSVDRQPVVGTGFKARNCNRVAHQGPIGFRIQPVPNQDPPVLVGCLEPMPGVGWDRQGEGGQLGKDPFIQVVDRDPRTPAVLVLAVQDCDPIVAHLINICPVGTGPLNLVLRIGIVDHDPIEGIELIIARVVVDSPADRAIPRRPGTIQDPNSVELLQEDYIPILLPLLPDPIRADHFAQFMGVFSLLGLAPVVEVSIRLPLRQGFDRLRTTGDRPPLAGIAGVIPNPVDPKDAHRDPVPANRELDIHFAAFPQGSMGSTGGNIKYQAVAGSSLALQPNGVDRCGAVFSVRVVVARQDGPCGLVGNQGGQVPDIVVDKVELPSQRRDVDGSGVIVIPGENFDIRPGDVQIPTGSELLRAAHVDVHPRSRRSLEDPSYKQDAIDHRGMPQAEDGGIVNNVQGDHSERFAPPFTIVCHPHPHGPVAAAGVVNVLCPIEDNRIESAVLRGIDGHTVPGTVVCRGGDVLADDVAVAVPINVVVVHIEDIGRGHRNIGGRSCREGLQDNLGGRREGGPIEVPVAELGRAAQITNPAIEDPRAGRWPQDNAGVEPVRPDCLEVSDGVGPQALGAGIIHHGNTEHAGAVGVIIVGQDGVTADIVHLGGAHIVKAQAWVTNGNARSHFPVVGLSVDQILGSSSHAATP